MSVPTHFNSGRKGAGKKFVADASGSAHARFMRLSSYALTPLGILSTWWLAGLVGLPFDRVREEVGHPFPALVLIAFAAILRFFLVMVSSLKNFSGSRSVLDDDRATL